MDLLLLLAGACGCVQHVEKCWAARDDTFDTIIPKRGVFRTRTPVRRVFDLPYSQCSLLVFLSDKIASSRLVENTTRERVPDFVL
jgi:hypothetical protein